MATENSQESNEVVNENTAAPEAPAAAPEVPAVEAKEGEEAPAYVPNHKYKILDKEFEFDEKVKKYVKAKEDEDFFRDLLTKAGGIDVIKPKLEKYREEATSYKTRVGDYESKLKKSDEAWKYFDSLVERGQKKDIAAAMELLDSFGFDNEFVGKVILDRLNLTPEQQEARQASRTSVEKQREYEQKMAEVESREKALASKSAQDEFNKALSANKDVSEFIKSFDNRKGEGYGMNKLIKFGQEMEQEIEREAKNLGKAPTYPSYDEVFKAFLDEYGYAPQAAAPKPNIPITKTITVSEKNTLPNVGGGSGSAPISKSINTYEDMMAAREEKLKEYGRKRKY